MAEVKKSAIKKNARGMAMSRDALEKFKDLIQTIKSVDGIDFGDDEGFDVLLEFYMNSVEMYNEIATEDGEEYRFYASTKKSKKIDKSRIAKISMYDMDNLIEALNRIDGTPWTAYIDAEISEYGPPKDFYDIYDVMTTVQEKYDEGYYNNYSASAKKSKMEKRASTDIESFIDTHYKEVNGEHYGEGYLTDDGWYDDQRYTIVTWDEIKIANRIFRMSSFGGGRTEFRYAKYSDDYLSYRIDIDVPNTMDGLTVRWSAVMDDGTIVKEGEYRVSDGEPSTVAVELAEKVRQCVREAEEYVKGGNDFYNQYDASAKKSIPKSKDTKMSFEQNVNKMRQSNYDRTGNINSVMKEKR